MQSITSNGHNFAKFGPLGLTFFSKYLSEHLYSNVIITIFTLAELLFLFPDRITSTIKWKRLAAEPNGQSAKKMTTHFLADLALLVFQKFMWAQKKWTVIFLTVGPFSSVVVQMFLMVTIPLDKFLLKMKVTVVTVLLQKYIVTLHLGKYFNWKYFYNSQILTKVQILCTYFSMLKGHVSIPHKLFPPCLLIKCCFHSLWVYQRKKCWINHFLTDKTLSPVGTTKTIREKTTNMNSYKKFRQLFSIRRRKLSDLINFYIRGGKFHRL